MPIWETKMYDYIKMEDELNVASYCMYNKNLGKYFLLIKKKSHLLNKKKKKKKKHWRLDMCLECWTINFKNAFLSE